MNRARIIKISVLVCQYHFKSFICGAAFYSTVMMLFLLPCVLSIYVSNQISDTLSKFEDNFFVAIEMKILIKLMMLKLLFTVLLEHGDI